MTSITRETAEKARYALEQSRPLRNGAGWIKKRHAALAALAAELAQPDPVLDDSTPGLRVAASVGTDRAPGVDAVPDGWALVPLEPTPEMMARGANCQEYSHDDIYEASAAVVYRAMIASAPSRGAADNDSPRSNEQNPSAPQAAAQAQGERERFEAWAQTQQLHIAGDGCDYAFRDTRSAWAAWQARASLSASTAAQPETPYAQLDPRTQAARLVDELREHAGRLTQRTNDPLDGLLEAAASAIEGLIAEPAQDVPIAAPAEQRDEMNDAWLEGAFDRAAFVAFTGNPSCPEVNVLRGFANRVLQMFGDREGMRDSLNIAYTKAQLAAASTPLATQDDLTCDCGAVWKRTPYGWGQRASTIKDDAAPPAANELEPDDQALDREAESITAEALGTDKGGINPNATSIDDIFDTPPAQSADARQDVIAMLLEVARAAYTAADDTEDAGDADFVKMDRAGYEALSAALDPLDDLPDDCPGMTMSGPGRAEWALNKGAPARSESADALDARRYQWLRAEHERMDTLCHLTWKKNGNRNSDEWVNTARLDSSVDAAMTAKPSPSTKEQP